VASETPYIATGWHQDKAGWVYVTPTEVIRPRWPVCPSVAVGDPTPETAPDCPVGGALAADGRFGQLAAAHIRLPEELSHVDLPSCGNLEDLKRAVRQAYTLRGLGRRSVIVPLIAATWRAALGGHSASVFVTGLTGTHKTSVVALCQQHYGQGFVARRLPATWASTANAIEQLGYAAKDILYAVDEFTPIGTPGEINA
jgi:hypothetical protein